MTLIRLSIAFLILVSATLFLILNIEEISESNAYLFLSMIIGFSVILLMLSGRWYVVTRVKTSQICLLFFLVYLVANLIFDTGNLDLVKAETIGTTGGLVFGLGLGWLLLFAISDIYLGMKKKQHMIDYGSFLIMLYLAIVLFMAILALQGNLADVRSDLFLVAEPETYQRLGNFLFIQFMLSSALIVLLYIFLDKLNKLVFVIALVLHTLTALIFMLLAQLVGSNSGLATVGLFFVMLSAFLYVAGKPGLREGFLPIGLKSIIFGWIGRRIVIWLGASLLVVALTLLYFLRYTEIEAALSLFRITGFGSGEIASFDSRIDIFKNNFIEQFSYNPIFGNTEVDRLTGQEGSYVHSLLSIMTHLGIVGFLIFGLYVFQTYREITRKYFSFDTLHTDRIYALFRLFSIGMVLLFALLTAFYTWLPLWFAFAFFGVGLSTFNHYHKSLPTTV